MMKHLKLFAMICLIAILVFAFIQTTYADETPLPVPVGRVVWVKGTLKAIMPNKEERILQKTSIIYLHDTLVTDDQSQAQIVFTDNSLMTFRPSTRFYINKYEFHPDNKGSVGKYFMDLLEGGFRTITGLIAKENPADYQVNTPVATIGVRGTDYAVYFSKGQVYMNYYAGTPCVSSGGSSLCLDSKTPYAFVPRGQAAPVALPTQPAVFRQKQDIVPAKVAPFKAPPTAAPTSPSGKTEGEATSTTSTTTQPAALPNATPAGKSPGAPVTTFCITQ